MQIKRILLVVLISIFIHNMYGTTSTLTFLNRILVNNEINTDKNYKRLSEGTILLPDNPSNYAIYEKLEANIRGLESIIRNNGDMISYYQTADGYLWEITELLQHIRELLLKKSNAIYSPEDREYIDSEINQYYDQIIYSLKNSEFNTKKIFKDLFTDKTITGQLHDKKYYQVSNVD
ncbi:MAG: flagellin, partial [Spirochaetales bacterium]|nr:flagellin [Spirochaetales bacterium]